MMKNFVIIFSIGVKIIFLLLALIIKVTLWRAVAANMEASPLVILNGLRLFAARLKNGG